jgi:hypothetical protein
MSDPNDLGLAAMQGSRVLGLTVMSVQEVFARPKQTINKQMTIVHFSRQETEKNEKTQTIDHRWQSIHDMSTRAAPCGIEYVCASI